MTSVPVKFGLLALLLCPPLLSACSEEHTDWRSNHRLVVERRPVSLTLAIQDETVVRPQDMTRLQSFVDVFIQRGEAPLAIAVAKGDGADAAEVAQRRADQLNELFVAMGIEQSGLAIRTIGVSSALPEGSALLGYDVYAVRVPQCGDWSDNSSFNIFSNDPSPSFGCSVSRNIGLMVDNPRDLVRPHALDGRDATRGATIIGKYRAGEDTVSKGSVGTAISSVGGSN